MLHRRHRRGWLACAAVRRSRAIGSPPASDILRPPGSAKLRRKQGRARDAAHVRDAQCSEQGIGIRCWWADLGRLRTGRDSRLGAAAVSE
jgi:hypothetical protein